MAVLMIAVLAAVLYYGYRNADATISPKIDSLFATIADGSFADGYEAETTQAFRDVTTEEQYAAIGKAIKLRLGELKSKSLQSVMMKQHNTTATIEVAYSAVFQKSTGTILATFEKQDNVWKIRAFRVNSPAFQKDLLTEECPQCGEPHAANAAFCPSCGIELPKKAIEEESEDSEPSDGD